MGSATVHPGELDQVRARYENELAALRARLAEAEETLRAIRSGEVDALVVQTAGDQIFTLSGADRPYRVMVETMQEGAATVSDGGLVLYANRRLGELLGTPLHRLIGTSASSFVATDDRAAFEHLRRDAARGGVHTDLKLQRAERDPFTVRIAASPLDLDDTHAVCLVITDLRFHHVFDDAPIGVVTVSVAAGSAGRFLQVNHAMCRLTGYSTDELLSLTVADVTHPDDVAETHDIYRGAATGALSQFREEQRYLRADGGVVWASTNGTVVRDRDGHPSYVIAHVEDITARKQAEHALADSEKRFRSVFFDAPIGVVMVGLAADPGRYLQVNQAFCDIIGYRADELGTRRFTDITHPDDGAGDATFLAQLLDKSFDGVDREKRYLRPDGTVVWASIRASTIRDEHGRPLYALAHIEDITARRQAQEQLSYQALHDPLTGLGNRHLLMARLQHALDALDRAAGAVAVLYIDLDGFKAVNDRVGHDTGDRFLIEIGRHIQRAVRRPDTAVRLGGDEFVVVAVGISDDSLLSIVERIKAAVTQSITIDIDTFTVSASVGVVVTHNSHDDPTDLLRAADLAMYQAKKDGRGRHQIFTDALRVQAMEHLDIEPELRRAIGRDLLRLYYQPVMDVRTGHAVGVEALLRLQHPTRGLLTPDAFLDVAETSGLIVPIGDWVLQHACRQQAAWQANLPGHLQMAVNLSGRQVLEYGLCDRIAAAIDDAGVDPHRLTIELTETVFTEASRSFLTDLDTLKARGVRFALDDFGTGYSSLAYLERFPVDIVKIDQRFVAGLGTNPHNTTIVTAIVNLGRTLGLDLVAEGVETPEQLARLADLGCDFVQGFYLQRPVPPGELDLSRTMPATPR